ncbi:MAG: SusD/RagB family nutrient-binding outer membrane lipoprotein, partial [Bacteroidetes bacterium]|nr:SusD/RagB family nutrient-binding outer membrane lipoprotein [Fibrella sp.]
MKKITYIVLLTALGLTSCEKYLDINLDPSNPQVAEGFALLPPMFAQMAQGEQFDSRYVGKYVQNWADAGVLDTWDRHGYLTGNDASGMIWRMNYWNLGSNLNLMLDRASAQQQWDYVGVAKAISAWSWQTTTDYHGEIVLKQAFEPNRYIFDYDSQEDVYAYVVSQANDALAALTRTDGNQGTLNRNGADLAYRGDKSKWIKFTYAVLARNLLHQSNKGTFNADKVIEYCDKSLASNADNFNVPHTAGANAALANFFGSTRSNVGTFRQTDFLLSLLDGRVFNAVPDPRLPLLATASPDGTYRGVVPTFGEPNNQNGNVRRIPTLWGEVANSVVQGVSSKYIFRDGADFPIITYAEVQFMKAEAAFKKGDRAVAYDAFRRGVSAAMEYAGVTAAARDAFLAGRALPATAADL